MKAKMSYVQKNNFEELVGAKVNGLFGDKESLGFSTDLGAFVYEAEGDCCSHSWFEHVTGLDNLIGHIVREVTVIEMADVSAPGDEDSEDRYYDQLTQCYGYRIATDKGYFEIEMRNESNGYYGGYVKYCKDRELPKTAIKEDS